MTNRFRPVARILDKPLGMGVEWLDGIDYDTDPTLDDGTILYVLDGQYDPNFGDDRICQCSHTYYRHFDTYDNMEPVGCKYCLCTKFTEANEQVPT